MATNRKMITKHMEAPSKIENKKRNKASPADNRNGKKRKTSALPKKPAPESLANILDTISDGFVALDAQMNYTYINKRGGELLRRKPEELVGKNYWEEYPEDIHTSFADVYRRALETQIPIQFEDYHAPSGRWFENRIFPSADGLSIFFTDITKRKQAETALREKDEQLQHITDVTPTLFSQCSRDLRYLFVNRATAKFLGFPAEEITGKPISEIVGKEAFNAILPYIERVLKGERVEYEMELPYRSANPRFMNVVYIPKRDDAGDVIGWIATMTDITEHKRNQLDLTEFTRQQMALYQLTDQLQRTKSVEAVFDVALDAILSALQCDRASILHMDDTEVMRFVAWRGLSADYRKATDGHSPWKPYEENPKPICLNDIRIAELSNSLRTVIEKEGIGSLAFIPLISKGKLIGKFMIYFNGPHVFKENEIELSRTIARQVVFGMERKQDEQALRESEERFRTLSNTVPSIVWTAAPDGTILYSNDQWFEYTGISAEQNAKDWPIVLHPDDKERCIQAWTHALETVPDEYLIEVRNRRYDGQYRWFQTRAVPAKDRAGKVIAWYGVTTDIHDRKKEEERLVLLAEISELIRSREDPNELMYAISEAVGEYLQVRRCLFNEIELENDREIVHRDYVRGVESVAGVHKLSDYSSITSAEMMAGKTVVNHDSMTDPRTAPDYERSYAPNDERAYIAVPLMREHEWVGTFWVSDDVPRQWSLEDVALLETVAERTWVMIEKLRIDIALRESEEKFRTLSQTAPALIWFDDPEGNCRYVNQQYLDFSGKTLNDLTGTGWHLVLHPEDVEDYLNDFLAAQKEQRLFRHRVRAQRYDGAWRWLESFAQPLYSANGTFLGHVGISPDITESVEAEETIRESEERYRFIVENTSDGIWQIELTEPMPLSLSEEEQIEWYYNYAIIRQCNLGLARMYGYNSVEEVIGLPIRVVMPRENPVNLELSLQFIRSNYRLVDAESREVSQNGRELVFLNNMIGVIEDGKLKGEWGTNRDITDRKHAEEALKQSEERFVRFMQYLPGLAWVKDLKGRYVYANSAAEKAFNMPREKLYGKTDEDIFPAEIAAQFMQNDQQALTAEAGMQFIETLQQEDGVLHYSLVSKFPIPGVDGRVTLIGGTAFDITERKQAEEALQESKERYRNLFNLVPIAVYTCDVNGEIQEFNQHAVDLWGREPLKNNPKEKFCGSFKIFYPDGRFMPHEECPMARILQGETLEPHELEILVERPDGMRKNVLAHPQLLKDERGEIIGAINCLYDFTERKQAERALEEMNLQLESLVQKRTATIQAINQTLRSEITERKLIEEALRESEMTARLLLNTAPDGLIITNEAGMIVHANPQMTSLFGYSSEEMIGQPIEFLIPERFHESHRQHRYRYMERRLRRSMGLGKDLFGRRKNTSEFPVDVMLSPLANMPGWDLMVTIRDNTEQKNMERALRKNQDRLRVLSQRLVQVQEEERRFLARELHDRAGQALAALNINLTIMRHQLSGDSLQRIGARLDDSLHIVDETITLVRDVMSDLRPAELDDYGLEAALQSYISQYTNRYGTKVEFEKPQTPLPRLGFSVEVTLLRIAQGAFTNIARHAQAEHVNVSLRQTGDIVQFLIEDDGVGIASQQDANRSGSHGLRIMRERAEAVGGTVRITSRPGQGTKVEARIPLNAAGQVDVEREKHI